jgi:cadmium resistance protein CadD (predicted permease)
MIRRISGAVTILLGAFLVFAQFALIADPAPGVRWNLWQRYSELIIGVLLLALGLYLLLTHRPSSTSPNVPPSAA